MAERHFLLEHPIDAAYSPLRPIAQGKHEASRPERPKTVSGIFRMALIPTP